MNSEEFKELYTMEEDDESITAFRNDIGFSLIRKYPKNSPYHKDGRRMFIKIGDLDKGFFYGVDMTKPQSRDKDVEYVITDGEEYNKKVTNFISDVGEFKFDKNSKKIIHQVTNKNFTMNEFVRILTFNHLSDRLSWKRKANSTANFILKFIFWLSDKHYDRVETAVDKFNFNQKQTYSEEKINNIDPFFKYFLIFRNTLFIGLFFAFLVAILFTRYKWIAEFTVANPLVTLSFFLLLSFCEKISIWLNEKIKDFFVPRKFYNEKSNFIEKLHEYQYQNKFKLKFKIGY